MSSEYLFVIADGNGYREKGYIRKVDIERCLKVNDDTWMNTILFIKNGMEMNIEWNLIKNNQNIQDYTKKELPEYLI